VGVVNKVSYLEWYKHKRDLIVRLFKNVETKKAKKNIYNRENHHVFIPKRQIGSVLGIFSSLSVIIKKTTANQPQIY
jgi:hypothetical protein